MIRKSGMTLIELMIVVAVIGIISLIAVPRFANLIARSKEATIKGKLGGLRSAITIYYSDTASDYPEDDLSCLIIAGKYISKIPVITVPDYHDKSNVVENNDDLGLAGLVTADNGLWKYWNWRSSTFGGREWGDLWVGCTHTDSKGSDWTSY